MKMKWISVNDMLPEIPEGKHSVSVLCSVHDPMYEECCPGHGSDVTSLSWDGKIFSSIAYGNGNWGFYPCMDIITHWMYMPKAFQVTDEGYSFSPKGYKGYLPEELHKERLEHTND